MSPELSIISSTGQTSNAAPITASDTPDPFESSLKRLRPTRPSCLESSKGRVVKRKSPARILSSIPISVVFGKVKDGKDEEVDHTLYAHEHVLYRSKVCRTMLESPFKEGKERKIRFPECDIETGANLLQWLYSGDYDTMFPEDVGTDGQAKQNESAQLNPEKNAVDKASAAPQTGSSIVVREISGPDTSACNPDVFQDDSWELSHPTTAFDRFVFFAKGLYGKAGTMSHHEILMQHAKLYTIADFLGLLTLKKLASKRLRAHVLWIGSGTLTHSIIDDIAQLARYLYQNTSEHDSNKIDEDEPLRNHITTFIADHFTDMRGEVFKAIMQEGGDMVTDVMKKVGDVLYKQKRQVLEIAREMQAMREVNAAIDAKAEPKPKNRGRNAKGNNQ